MFADNYDVLSTKMTKVPSGVVYKLHPKPPGAKFVPAVLRKPDGKYSLYFNYSGYYPNAVGVNYIKYRASSNPEITAQLESLVGSLVTLFARFPDGYYTSTVKVNRDPESQGYLLTPVSCG